MNSQTLYWCLFIVGIVIALAVDLSVLRRSGGTTSTRQAFLGVAFWVSLAAAFGGFIWQWRGHGQALEFLTGYLVEESLSVDNIFVFVLLFQYFKTPEPLQRRVLFWGILGAIVMRAALILVGSALIHRFHWVIYLFGAFLVYTGLKLFRHGSSEVAPDRNPALRLFSRFFPITESYDEGRFFTRRDGRMMATPLALVLVMIETTDLVFALDSIPAIFGVTRDPFIVFTSNIFAVLGLRSLYFLMAGVIGLFRYLQYGLALTLVFIGAKMVGSAVFNLSIVVSLGIVFTILLTSVLASVWIKPKEPVARDP